MNKALFGRSLGSGSRTNFNSFRTVCSALLQRNSKKSKLFKTLRQNRLFSEQTLLQKVFYTSISLLPQFLWSTPCTSMTTMGLITSLYTHNYIERVTAQQKVAMAVANSNLTFNAMMIQSQPQPERQPPMLTKPQFSLHCV